MKRMQLVFVQSSLFTFCKLCIEYITACVPQVPHSHSFIICWNHAFDSVMNFHYIIPYWLLWAHDKSERILGKCLMMPFNALKKWQNWDILADTWIPKLKCHWVFLLNAYRWRRERIRPWPQWQDPVGVSVHISPGLLYFSLCGGLETDSGDRRRFNPLLSGSRYIGYNAVWHRSHESSGGIVSE